MNERNVMEYRLVSDGKGLYRLHPIHKLPKGVFEVKVIADKCVYDTRGKLKPAYKNAQRIEPSHPLKYLTHCIRSAIYGNNYNAS